MPAAVQEPNRPDYSEQMWRALKAHILRERARKKQEREQEVEEERLRKEREAREQQDVMTLGQTREQLSQLEKKLSDLKEEKHQLFIQLKKVLNEDDNRRRQLRDNIPNEPSSAMEQLQQNPSNLNQQLYIPPPTRLATMPQQQPQQQQPQQQQQAQQQSSFRGPITKRIRSPSPAPQVPVSLYHSYGYKPPTVTASSYQSCPQKDDGRRNELARAVLWNKAQQYTSQPSAFYPVPPQELPMYYSARGVFDSPRPLSEHYAMRTPVPSHGHIMHPASLPINPSSSQQKAGGSITAGYPVRTQQQQYQQSPGPSYQQAASYQQQQAQGPSAQYTTQSRPLYQPQGGPMNYNPHPPQRE